MEIRPALRPLHTEEDYRAALLEVSAYFDNEPLSGTPDGDRFEILLTLIDAYHTERYPINLPDPVEAIKRRMDQAGLTPKDLSTTPLYFTVSISNDYEALFVFPQPLPH
jgi:HTH-type transcriptional regulator/antitoxin HigA